jgi:hypothetical protein
MEIRSWFSRRYLLVVSAFALLCFGVLIVGGRPSRSQSSTKSDIKVINKTATLEVLSVRPTDHNLQAIVLKNVSSKPLNGYSVAVGNGRITIDISSGDRVIPPGQTDELEIPIDLIRPDITILAAMFADGSIEGDEAVVAELREWRFALKKQLSRSLSALDATLESPDVNAEKALDRLESQFSSLDPDSVIESRIAGDTLNTEIQILRENRQRQGALKQRQRLLDLKARIERRIASL